MRDRPSAEVALVLLLCAVALVFAAPILPHLHDWGVLDWDQHLFHHAVPRATILDYHELPLWNPYNWSGVPLLANPESRVLAPTFPLILLFGEVVGLKLELLVHLVIGMLGAFHLLRHRGVGRPGSLAAAFVFMLNSWYALHMTVGHTWALNVAYLPWAFLFYLKAIDNVRYASAASIVLVLIFFGGGIYLVIMAAMLFWFYAAASCAISPRETRRHARALAAISVQTVLLTAVKLLPAIELMFEHPRRTGVHTGYTVTALLNALFARSQTLSSAYAERPEEFYAWLHEGMYVGLIGLVPFLIGAAGKPRQRAPLLVVLLLFVWIALGDHAPLSLWSGLHALPVFDNLRMTQRFGICAVLIFAIFVGHGIDSGADAHAKLDFDEHRNGRGLGLDAPRAGRPHARQLADLRGGLSHRADGGPQELRFPADPPVAGLRCQRLEDPPFEPPVRHAQRSVSGVPVEPWVHQGLQGGSRSVARGHRWEQGLPGRGLPGRQLGAGSHRRMVAEPVADRGERARRRGRGRQSELRIRDGESAGTLRRGADGARSRRRTGCWPSR